MATLSFIFVNVAGYVKFIFSFYLCCLFNILENLPEYLLCIDGAQLAKVKFCILTCYFE